MYCNSKSDLLFSFIDAPGQNQEFSFGNTHGLHNVTVERGSTAYLHCPVINLGEKEVHFKGQTSQTINVAVQEPYEKREVQVSL